VISGKTEHIDRATTLADEKGAKRVISLDVNGAFHSTLMASASHKLAQALKDVVVVAPKIPVISNVTAYSQDNPEDIKENLIDQVSTTTRWEESIRHVSERGIKQFLEIGPGTVLKGLLKRIDPALICYNIAA
jgi:[acyl-carrier-protein] S-malonyltransferase